MPIVIRHDDPALLANQALAVGAEKQRQVNFNESLQQQEQQQRQAQDENQYAQQIQQNAERAREFQLNYGEHQVDQQLEQQRYDQGFDRQKELEQMRLDAEDKRQQSGHDFSAQQTQQKEQNKQSGDWWKDVTGAVGNVAKAAGRFGSEFLRQAAMNQREQQRDAVKQQIHSDIATGQMNAQKARQAKEFFESGIKEAHDEWMAAIKQGDAEGATQLGEIYKKRIADLQDVLRPATQPSTPPVANQQQQPMQVPHLSYGAQPTQQRASLPPEGSPIEPGEAVPIPNNYPMMGGAKWSILHPETQPASPQQPAQSPQSQPVPATQPSGRIYVNPQTGQKIRWNGSAWELAQ